MLPKFLNKPKQHPKKLVSKDSTSFIDYQCKFGVTKLARDKPLFAEVVDPRRFGMGVDGVHTEPDGTQTAVLRVASEDGGFLVLSSTLSKPQRPISIGDTVIWLPGTYLVAMGEAADDERFGWVGLITHVIKPEINLNAENGEITVTEYF